MPVYLDTILFPSGDGAGTFEAIGGPTAKWQTVNSGIEEPFDSTYLRASGVEVDQAGGKTQFLNLEELPPYFNTMDTISGIVRLRVHNQEDDYNVALQFFEGDSTTPLTSASGKSHSQDGIFQSSEGIFVNHTFNFDLKNRNHGFCVWEDALLKITVESDEESSPVDISEIQVNAIYTSGAGRCADGRPIRHCDCDPPVATDGTCCWCDKTTNPASFSYYCVENITPADCFSQYPNSSWAKVAGGCSSRDCSSICGENKWTCVDPEITTIDRCIEASNGQYLSQQECLDACKTTGWNCVGNACVEVDKSVSTYATQAECESACWLWECSGVPDPNDIPGGRECECVQSPNGTYDTQDVCRSGEWWWGCSWDEVAEDSICIQTSSGIYLNAPICSGAIAAEGCPATDCCQWDGVASIVLSGVTCDDNNVYETFTVPESPPGSWNWESQLACGDNFSIGISCNSEAAVGPDKWQIDSFSATCMDIELEGELTPATCDVAPSWLFKINSSEGCAECCPSGDWICQDNECVDVGTDYTGGETVYGSEQECQENCSIPSGACCYQTGTDGWECMNYKTEEECTAFATVTNWYEDEVCVDCTWLYECVTPCGDPDGCSEPSCVRTADGTYATKALCIDACVIASGACCYRPVKEILRPNGHTGNPWDSFNYTLINDDVEYPTAAEDDPEIDSDIAVCDNSDDGDRGTWDMTAVTTLTSITNCRIYLRHRGDGSYSDPVNVELYVGGSWQTAVSLSITSSFAWVYADFSGSWSSSDFDDALLGITTGPMGGGGEYHLSVAYFELSEGDPADPGEEWTCVENQTEEQCSSFSGETKWYRDETCEPDCDWLYECVDQSATDPSNPTVCVRTADGTHETKALCEAACNDPLPSGACCVNDGGDWTCYPDRTSQQCSDLGAAATYSNWYLDEDCVDCTWLYECVDGSCVRTADGTYATKALCVADCVPVGACCVDDVCTENQTQEECSGLAVSAVSATWYVNETCDPDCDWLYECTEVSGCVRTPDGTYETKELCDSYCIMGRCCWIDEEKDDDDELVNVEKCATIHESGCAELRVDEVIDPLVSVSGWVSGVNCTDDPCEWYDSCCNWDGKVTISFAGPSGLYLDPNSDILRFGFGGGSYTDVNDSVRVPVTDSNGRELNSFSIDEYIQFGTEDVPPIPATSFAVSVLISTDSSEGSGVELTWAGTPQGFKPHSEAERPGGEWEQYKWDIVTDLSNGVAGNAMKITNGLNTTQSDPYGDMLVKAAYIEVDYVCNQDAPDCPYCSHSEEIQMTGCREDFYPNAIIPHCWEYFGKVECGDTVALKVYCDPDLPVSDSGKWTLTQFDRSCAVPMTPSATGVLSNPEECDESPSFYGKWTQTKDCDCCREHCCDFDGNATLDYGCWSQPFTMTKISEHIWEFGSSGIGDARPTYGDLGGNDFYARLSCDPDKDISDFPQKLIKWTLLSYDLPCGGPGHYPVGPLTGAAGYVTFPECDTAPVWLFNVGSICSDCI